MEFERGFHGWLVFFFVTACLGLLARGYILFQAGEMLRLVLGEDSVLLIAASIARLLVHTALLLAALHGLRLFLDEDPRTPTFWATLFLVSIVGTLVNHSLIAVQTAHFEQTTFGAALRDSLWPEVLRGMAVYVGWALYWMHSTRVRLTYGGNAFAPHPDRRPNISAPVT